MKLFNVISPQAWNHHGNGGWGYVSKHLLDQLHHPKGVIFYDWLDGAYKAKSDFSQPWSGILHNTIESGSEYSKYNFAIPSLKVLVETQQWQDSLSKCVGIYTLSENTTNFISNCCVANSLRHPVELNVSLSFDLDRYYGRVITIGQWMRRYHSIFNLDVPMKAILKTGPAWEQDYKEVTTFGNVKMLDFVSRSHYDRLLSESVVFIDFYDVAACNVVLECIARNTPILTNKLNGNMDYLGIDYPFYFSDMTEANEKIKNLDLIKQTHLYLKKMDKTFLDVNSFINNIKQSSIYKSIAYPFL